MSCHTGPVSLDNAGQIECWSGSVGASWALAADRMDHELHRLGVIAMDALAPAADSKVLDVGCGAGATTIELARRVGASGSAMGVDVSAPLLDIARRRAIDSGLGNVTFLQTDAQDMVPGTQFDAVFSRFGVMFFADPVAAFANLRSCATPGGRLGFVCWQSLADNPWFGATSTALNGMAGVQLPPPPDSGDPGPFALAAPGRIRQILHDAGWRDAQVHAEVDELYLDEAAIDERVDFAVRHGPAASALADAASSVRTQAAERIRAALLAFDRDGKVRYRRAIWVVTAQA